MPVSLVFLPRRAAKCELPTGPAMTSGGARTGERANVRRLHYQGMHLCCDGNQEHTGGASPVKRKSAIVAAFTPEAVIKRKIRAHLRKLGFHKGPGGTLVPPSTSKESVRALHYEQRSAGLKEQRAFVQRVLPELQHYFAEGNEVDPSRVEPVLELIKAHTWQSDLFRLASLSWSVPVSAGYGRRLRYLVWDKSNDKLIGIIALGDPVFNLKARDDLIGWSAKDREKRLVNILDAYVLGAVPPYNILLGGKLVSCLVRSREVRDDFTRRYGKHEV